MKDEASGDTLTLEILEEAYKKAIKLEDVSWYKYIIGWMLYQAGLQITAEEYERYKKDAK